MHPPCGAGRAGQCGVEQVRAGLVAHQYRGCLSSRTARA